MLYDIHLILPEDTEFDNMPEQLQTQLNSLDARWPSFPCIGTRPVDGKKLIHARIRHHSLTKSILEGLVEAHDLTWEVAGIRKGYKTPATYDSEGGELQAAYYPVIEPIDKAKILPFLADINELDEGGSETTRPVQITDTVYLPMYSGTDPIIL